MLTKPLSTECQDELEHIEETAVGQRLFGNTSALHAMTPLRGQVSAVMLLFEVQDLIRQAASSADDFTTEVNRM